MGIRSTCFDSFDKISVHRQVWGDTVTQNGFGPGQEWEWLQAVWHNFKEGKRLFIEVLDDETGIRGVMPFVTQYETRKCVTTCVLKPLSHYHQLGGTPCAVAPETVDAMLNAIVSGANSDKKEWHIWFMVYRRDEPQAGAFETFLRRRGYRFLVDPAGSAPYLTLQARWGDLLAKLGSRFRTQLRSREKKLRSQGSVELRWLDTAETWEKGLRVIEEIESASWKSKNGFPITHPLHWRFYQLYAATAAESKKLRLPILYVNEEPVAFDYGVCSQGRYYLLQTSYKENWNAFYPGSVLRKLVIEQMCQDNVKEFDFGLGEAVWKARWTNEAREYNQYTVFNRSPKGFYLYWLHAAQRCMRSVTKVVRAVKPI